MLLFCKSFFQHSKRKEAFTLIEILIVMSIMAVLVTGGSIGYRRGLQIQNVKNAKNILISEIKMMKNLALSNKKLVVDSSPTLYAKDFLVIIKNKSIELSGALTTSLDDYSNRVGYKDSNFPSESVEISSVKLFSSSTNSYEELSDETIILSFSRPRGKASFYKLANPAPILEKSKSVKIKVSEKGNSVVSKCIELNRISGLVGEISCQDM